MGIRAVKGILLNIFIGLVSCKICCAGTIDVNANWKYITDNEDTNDITSTYNVNINLDQYITETISLNESLRYNMQIDEENEVTQTATPNLSLAIKNYGLNSALITALTTSMIRRTLTWGSRWTGT